MTVSLTLYSRPGCCLCEEMHTILTEVQKDIPFTLEHIDISVDPALASRWSHEIPVLWINGRKAFKYRVTAAELRQRLRRERVAPAQKGKTHG